MKEEFGSYLEVGIHEKRLVSSGDVDLLNVDVLAVQPIGIILVLSLLGTSELVDIDGLDLQFIGVNFSGHISLSTVNNKMNNFLTILS